MSFLSFIIVFFIVLVVVYCVLEFQKGNYCPLGPAIIHLLKSKFVDEDSYKMALIFLWVCGLLFFWSIIFFLLDYDPSYLGVGDDMFGSWRDWIFKKPASSIAQPAAVSPDESNPLGAQVDNIINNTPPPEEEEEEEYDAFVAMFGEELTWWEWIKDSVYRWVYGEPEDPFVPFEEYFEDYFDRHKVPHFKREDYMNEACPPYVPPPPEGSRPMDPATLLRDFGKFLWETIKNLLKDAWNVFKFSIYYTDQTLRYFFDLIPISKSTWQYLTLLAISITALGYMNALMFHEETLYTRIMFADMRHIPIREIYFFHEYFLCWSAIIVCLLLSTLVK